MATSIFPLYLFCHNYPDSTFRAWLSMAIFCCPLGQLSELGCPWQYFVALWDLDAYGSKESTETYLLELTPYNKYLVSSKHYNKVDSLHQTLQYCTTGLF